MPFVHYHITIYVAINIFHWENQNFATYELVYDLQYP